jgi:hypothetical protein
MVPEIGDSAWQMLMNPRAFEPDLDCVSVINIAYDPTRFKHDPRHGAHSAPPTTLRYFHAVNEDKNVIVIILVNLANGFFVTHGSTLGFRLAFPGGLRLWWGGNKEVPDPGATEVGANTKASLLPGDRNWPEQQRFHARSTPSALTLASRLAICVRCLMQSRGPRVPEQASQIGDLVHVLADPVGYVNAVVSNFVAYGYDPETSAVRIGVTGSGVAPNYRIEKPSVQFTFNIGGTTITMIETPGRIFNGPNHREMTELYDLERHAKNWSENMMMIVELKTLLSHILHWTDDTAAAIRSAPVDVSPPKHGE